ncbi:MAG TPA: hypothetical protein EYP29_03365, partial [Thermoplasmata archaeon]|nr:hypothetical protein [Thermoplasmata archaeon]
VKKETTRDDGTTKQMTLTHRLLTKNGETLFSPYTVLILKGEGTNKEEVMMDSKKNLSILWYDPTRFGESVSIGDLDGDGVEDYAVGAPNYDGNGNNSGAVFLYKGRENLVLEDLTTENYDAIIYGERAHDHFGTSVSLNGDLNGDGFADLIVGAPYTNFSEPRGINAHYYHWVDETKFGVLVFETKEDNIDHDWEQGKPYDKVNKDQFAVRWDGFINIERSGHYTFYLEIDDGGRLYIDEELLIESWKDQQATEYPSDPVYLEKGLHNFVVEYYENGGAASIKFKWSSEYFEKEVVPPEAFRYTKERGAGKGGVYIIPGGRSFEELKKSNNALELSSTVLTMERYVEEFGKGVNYLGDLNGDGFDEVGVLAEREGSEGETLYIYHGSPIITTYHFKPLIASLLEDEDGSKNFTLLFPENEWMNMVSGNRGTFNVSSEGYLNINTSHSVNAYAYVVSKNPFLSGIDFTIKFKKRSSQELYPILSIMNYPVPEEDVADSEKQREATLLQIYDKGMIEIFTSPGSIGKEIELQNPGSYPELRIVVTPEHENITIYQSGKRIAGFDISNWSEGLYLLIGDSYTGSHQGKGTILKISSSLYWEMFNTNYSFLSFWDGELIDNDKSEFVISSYNTMIFKNSGMRVFPVLENETILYSNGDFNKIKYENGTLSLDFGMNDILPNGNFDNGWDNWTRTTNVRDKNNGHWEITTEEHGDWKVYKGPTAGLGPDRDYVGQNNRGRPCDGRLVSEPFVVPAGTKYIDLWHHAKWWSFEVVENLYQSDYDDMIIIRVRESDTGEVVDEVVYKRPSPDGPKNGEEEGRLQLDVSDYGGHKLQLEAEVVTNYDRYDDGLVQIDDIKALTLFKNGSFTSANISVEERVKVLLPQW